MRKPSPTSSRNYFTKETDEWVVKYNQTEDHQEKEKIFKEHLYYPFYKLAENIINTFKFYHMDVDTIEDLKLDVITMIVQDKLAGFDPTRGTKAFSYFGTIIKRWLIAYCNANYNRKKRHVSVDSFVDSLPEKSTSIETTPTITLSAFLDNWVMDTEEQLPTLFPDTRDMEVANALLTVFKSRRDLQLFKKKDIYIYVREITGCDTPYLTKVVTTLKKSFYEKYKALVREGLLDLEDSDL